MLPENKALVLTEEEFRLIRDLIRDYCGIFFEDTARYIVERRLARRVTGHHFSSFRDYYRFLRYDKRREEELAVIMDVLTVNETYFFREQNQLKAFGEEILPELRDRNAGRKKLRIWSAGCSTGEEPYTIAMIILEKGLFAGWDVEIVGSDINQRVLHVAREGTYRKNSFRTIEDYYVRKYFSTDSNGLYRIADLTREFVTFSYLNLLDPFKVQFLGQFDVIFCRNVLIYFDTESRKKVIHMFYRHLNSEGYLLLGHAESLINLSTEFSLKHLKHDMVYTKQGMKQRSPHGG